jgi:hypothetical protein
LWKSENPETKEKYFQQAASQKRLHQALYPNHIYTYKKKSDAIADEVELKEDCISNTTSNNDSTANDLKKRGRDSIKSENFEGDLVPKKQRKEKNSQPPRPRNSFIIYRSEKLAELLGKPEAIELANRFGIGNGTSPSSHASKTYVFAIGSFPIVNSVYRFS